MHELEETNLTWGDSTQWPLNSFKDPLLILNLYPRRDSANISMRDPFRMTVIMAKKIMFNVLPITFIITVKLLIAITCPMSSSWTG